MAEVDVAKLRKLAEEALRPAPEKGALPPGAAAIWPGDAALMLARQIPALLDAFEDRDRLVSRLRSRLARVLRYAHAWSRHMGTGVWSRRAAPPRDANPGGDRP